MAASCPSKSEAAVTKRSGLEDSLRSSAMFCVGAVAMAGSSDEG
jgi:hypothetical protein